MKNIRKSCISSLESFFSPKESAKIEKILFDAANMHHGDENIEEFYLRFSYEKIGQLASNTSTENVQRILKDSEEGIEGWKSAFYQHYKTQYLYKLDTTMKKPASIKGIYKCKEKDCNSDEFYVWSQQTRSGDEGMTQFRKCAICGKRKKE